jgi:hypothetical protein
MNREEAIDKAVTIVDAWSIQPTKTNGYPIDGWRAPSLEEKTDAVTKLAEFMWEIESDIKVVVADAAWSNEPSGDGND